MLHLQMILSETLKYTASLLKCSKSILQKKCVKGNYTMENRQDTDSVVLKTFHTHNAAEMMDHHSLTPAFFFL